MKDGLYICFVKKLQNQEGREAGWLGGKSESWEISKVLLPSFQVFLKNNLRERLTLIFYVQWAAKTFTTNTNKDKKNATI